MSLWTPDGERPVRPDTPEGPAPGPGTAPDGAGAIPDEAVRSAAAALGIDPDTLSPEDRERLVAMVTQMAEAQRRLAETPAAELIANHAMGLYELAAIKLSTEPPQMEESRLAIDAMGALLDTTGDHLGEASATLNDALATIRSAWVQANGSEG